MQSMVASSMLKQQIPILLYLLVLIETILKLLILNFDYLPMGYHHLLMKNLMFILIQVEVLFILNLMLI